MGTRATEPKRILIIEDDEAILSLLQQVLELEGYVVSRAANGMEGMRLLRTAPIPDLIMVDLTMPMMNGLQFITEKESHAEFKAIPVVLMTADSRFCADAADTGVEAILMKPLNIDNIVATLKKVLEKKPK